MKPALARPLIGESLGSASGRSCNRRCSSRCCPDSYPRCWRCSSTAVTTCEVRSSRRRWRGRRLVAVQCRQDVESGTVVPATGLPSQMNVDVVAVGSLRRSDDVPVLGLDPDGGAPVRRHQLKPRTAREGRRADAGGGPAATRDRVATHDRQRDTDREREQRRNRRASRVGAASDPAPSSNAVPSPSPRQRSTAPPKVPGPLAARQGRSVGRRSGVSRAFREHRGRRCTGRDDVARAGAAGRRALGAIASSGGVRLDRQDLVEPSPVARLAAEGRPEERHRALERGLGPDHPGAERQDVHVVVLDALVRRIRVVADGRPDAAHLVGGHRRADARAADEDPALRLAGDDRVTEPLGEVRVVVVRVGAVAAEVDRGRGRGPALASRRISSSLRSAPA